MAYKLLAQFQRIFDGKKYKHRSSGQGDVVASYLFEDLYDLARSKKFVDVVKAQTHVSNRKNKQVGKTKRRGDGTFGERVPSVIPVLPPGLAVAIGDVATIEIGAEVKVMAKAMIKQLDRVGGDMEKQIAAFQKDGDNPICIGIVGINQAQKYTSYEGRRVWTTTGRNGYLHPFQEAAEAERRLLARVASQFFEVIVLRFTVSNTKPFKDFQWVDLPNIERHYGASLLRISREYERRF